MGFRRDGRYERRWKVWCKANALFLTEECGVPLFVVTDRELWFHFLDHGIEQPFESCFSVDDLSAQQYRKLCAFLSENDNEEFGGPGILSQLRPQSGEQSRWGLSPNESAG